MPKSNILVVAVDGLRASALGAYGNTSVSTPAIDEFAAESFVLDWCYAPSTDLTANYRALWQSLHPARDARSGDGALSLPGMLEQSGYETTLVTDEPELSSIVATTDFTHRQQLPDAFQNDAKLARAGEVSQTSLARLFASACDAVEADTSDQPRLVWIHSRGMYGPWDAPLALQQSLLDEDDPPAIESVTPPKLVITDSDDPDSIFRYSAAYAAQTMVLDACWTGLMESAARAHANAPWLIMLLGARGFPLGEHQRIGGVDARLYGEQLHVPWILKLPDGSGRLARSGQLVSHMDLQPTIAQFAESSEQDSAARADGMSILDLVHATRPAWREQLISIGEGGERSIRTPEWSLRQVAAEDGNDTVTELFVRPDDRWEANDVMKLCPDVVESLAGALDDELQRISQNEAATQSHLPQ